MPNGQPPDAEQAPEMEAPTDTYAGPQEGDFVGDDRRLRVISIDPGTGKDRAIVGEAWQDDSGKLHGRGIVAIMLFEPMSAARYMRASVGLDLSPLTMLYARIARSPLFRVEFTEGSNAGTR